MDKSEALRISKLYIDAISNKYSVLQAFLFGSFAKGTFHEDSDIDIAVVIGSAADIIDTQIDMMKLRRKVDLRIEPHPFVSRDFNIDNPVVNEILKYGIRIQTN
ncbi:MAG TPA: nucleotidyltransferase domain-containing protein [Bacteroidales bacterium]|nr:nucleotidyltransferase domain-containing protein [Bacteroidales bacterium]